MQISSRFTLAVHIFACIDTFSKDQKVTSQFLAGSTNVNPVIIRRLLSQLRWISERPCSQPLFSGRRRGDLSLRAL